MTTRCAAARRRGDDHQHNHYHHRDGDDDDDEVHMDVGYGKKRIATEAGLLPAGSERSYADSMFSRISAGVRCA